MWTEGGVFAFKPESLICTCITITGWNKKIKKGTTIKIINPTLWALDWFPTVYVAVA
jgi:hypothetical protein